MVPAVLAHYRVIRSIGAGGMGEVFLAEDTKLGRQVALKVLAHAMADDPERRARFEREARAVAALNHPNIITIHSVEEHDGVVFLTMELVEGQTLTELIPRQGMTLDQLLHIAIPLSDAIGAAHQRGITHRDLKPANVMVSNEGRVKVLDFGLAKLREESPLDGLAPTMAREPFTSEGRILGTVAYMSPEQALGKPVDARSDVFSLGILLFEMATGGKPFKGDTSMSVLSAIIKDTPPSVTDLRQDLPRDVGRILRRCLAKGPDDRYQTATDLRNDLRLLKEDTDSDTAGLRQAPGVAGPTATVRPAPPRGRAVAILALGAVVAAAAAGGWWYARRAVASSTPAFSAITMRRLTNTGTSRIAAISPDGRYVVHDDGSFDKPSLWMRQASTASSTQILPPMPGTFLGLAFSPDGEAVLYVFRPQNSQVASLFQIPLLGNVPPRKLVESVDTPPAFSPDGARMAFIRGMADGARVIVIAHADGTDQRPLASRPEQDTYARTRVAWSPDGTLIAAFAGEMPRQKCRIVLVSVTTGQEQPFGAARFDFGGQVTWLGDGSALVFDAIERYGGRWNANSQLWSIAYPAGTLRRITPDVASYSSVAAAAGGRTLVAVRVEVRASLWVAPEGDTARAHPITSTSNGREGAAGIDWTPDGRIVYGATTQDSWDVWIANADGSQPRPLTSDLGVENQPRVLPDGRSIIFTSRATGGSDVLVRSIDVDGGNPRQIDTGGAVYRGYVQVGSAHVYFKVLEEGRPVAYRVPIAGGPREPLFADPARLPTGFEMWNVSPDEQWAVGTYVDPRGAGTAVVPIDGRGAVRRWPYTYTPGMGFGHTWAPGGRAVEDLVFRDGTTNLWRFPLDGSAPRPVTTFTSEHILDYRWSPDGKTLAMSRGTVSTDVVLITSDERKE